MDTQKASAFIRLAVLLYAVTNASLLAFDINPLPFTDEEVSAGITAVIAFGSSVYAWWKNAPITKEAKEAQAYLDDLKAKNK